MQALPTSIEFDPSTGNVYFIESNSNKIGRLVPTTNTITEWTIPTNANESKLIELALGFGANEVYFIESNSNKIGRLVPTTNTITEWTIPTNASLPTSIEFDPSTGNVYFIESNSNKIGRLVPLNTDYTNWTLDKHPAIIDVDSSGNIHYLDETLEILGRMS